MSESERDNRIGGGVGVDDRRSSSSSSTCRHAQHVGNVLHPLNPQDFQDLICYGNELLERRGKLGAILVDLYGQWSCSADRHCNGRTKAALGSAILSIQGEFILLDRDITMLIEAEIRYRRRNDSFASPESVVSQNRSVFPPSSG